MLENIFAYDPGVDAEYSDRITSLLPGKNSVLIGREDGVIEAYGPTEKYKTTLFTTEFDYLENEDIKEKITAIEQMTDGGVNSILFVGNEKSIKTLQVRPMLPTLDICREVQADEYRMIEIDKKPNIHSYVLNSLSLNVSKTSLLSSDFIRINLWCPERMEQFYNLVDIKPNLTNGIIFVINSAKFSPYHDSIFAYSASNGMLCLHDIDASPSSQRIAEISADDKQHIKSISDFAYVNPNQIACRQLNTVSLFDIRNPTKAVFIKDLLLNPGEKNKINCAEAIYQTFKISSDEKFIYTGSYFNSVYSINPLNAETEEIVVGPERQFSTEKRARHIVDHKNGFYCAYDGKVLRYDHRS
ncbi:serine/threonine-protein phosphatase 2A regulatory subunit B [Enteropsectra breve]|nr:serine/threonine-protein phosphatase 2A regulatory subunit B [Enteropsectra breve]